jgi:hypothetical protein
LRYCSGVNPWTLVRFQLGNAAAIRTVAQNSAALPFAIALVLLTAVARNYDQSFIGESILWLLGPLIFSFFSGSMLCFIVHKGFTERHFPKESKPDDNGQWIRFMTLFWMTAPVAWLYAIPVERFFDSYPAAQANLALLMIVSLWRVLLMSRIISVVNHVPYVRALLWVLLGASIEVIIVGFFGALTSKRILASMGGMRNSPEENLMGSAIGTAWAVMVVLAFVLLLWRFREETTPFPSRTFGKAPWLALLALASLWAFVAWPEQLKQHRHVKHRKLVTNERYAEALDFLGQHKRSSFPAGRRLEPNPYEYNVWDDLPPTIALLTSNTSPWIRELYLDSLNRTFVHHFPGYRSLTNVEAMYAAIERLPEGADWLKANESAIARHGFGGRYMGRNENDAAVAVTAQTNILNTFQRMGMSETNLARLKEE